MEIHFSDLAPGEYELEIEAVAKNTSSRFSVRRSLIKRKENQILQRIFDLGCSNFPFQGLTGFQRFGIRRHRIHPGSR